MDGTEIQIGQSEALNAPRRLTSILITDICEFSRLAENDEASAIRLTDVLYALFESTTERHGGRVFKRIADGFLAEFPSAQSAMAVALEFLEEVKARNNLAPNAIKAEIRAALHVGDVTDRADGDIMGHGVNIASRLQELAEPGTILASSNIMNLLGRDFPYKGVKRGNLALKNISEPVTAFQIDPDKDGGFQWPILPGFFKTRNLAYLLIGATVLFGALTLQAQRQERLLDEKLDRIMVQSFDNQSSVSNGVSAPYIRNVLENLHRSNIPSHQASFALLEEGNIPMAIQRLEDSLDGMDAEDPLFVETLHQIAALSYHHDPMNALAAYETILTINPDDKTAFLWLFRTNNLLGRPQDTISYYQDILNSKDHSKNDYFRLQMDMAFQLMLQGEFESAKTMLEPLEPELISYGDEEFYIRWRTELGFVNYRLGELESAEELIQMAIEKMEQREPGSSLPRAQNVMGLIHEKYASQADKNRNYHLNEALKFYEAQLRSGRAIDKTHEITEALHYVARLKFELGDIVGAKTDYLNSYRMAKSNNYANAEFMSLLGLAQIDKFNNDQKSSCENVKKAETLYQKKMGQNLGPITRKIIEDIGCDFLYAKDG